MIVDRIFASYESDGRRKPGTGYPTGSRLGTCVAQLQMLRFPELTNPEVPQPRDIMRWDEGNRTEEWLAGELQRAFPNLTGLRQEPFYFRVPLPEDWMVNDLRLQINRRQNGPDGPRLWGTVYDERPFVPPSIRMEEGRVRLRLMPCGAKCDGGTHGWGCGKKKGFILDPHSTDGPAVWVPTYIDFAALHESLGLAIVEGKSMSNYAFRRAILGDLDQSKRMQLVGLVEATGLPVVLAAYRKETSHMAEIAYSPTVDRVRVIITKMNGQNEAFIVDKGQLVTEATGQATEFPHDTTWNRAEVWTPYDGSLITRVHEHVRAVLFAKAGQWQRQYGPTFRCERCDGTGTQTTAKGTGLPLKKPKPCEDCGATGRLDEVEAPNFPCGYCAVIGACYPFARLKITDKPRYLIARTDWEASGLTFTPPEGVPVPPAPEVTTVDASMAAA